MAVALMAAEWRLLDVLGIKSTDVRSVDIHFEAGCIPTVVVAHHVFDGAGELVEELSRYELREREAEGT